MLSGHGIIKITGQFCYVIGEKSRKTEVYVKEYTRT